MFRKFLEPDRHFTLKMDLMFVTIMLVPVDYKQRDYSTLNTWSVRKVSDRIFLCEHLMDYNLARLHEPTLNLSAHA